MIQLKNKDIKHYREHILEHDQNGLCAICGKPPKNPCLDHHHKKKIKGTGQIRGVVCSSCNIFLAKSENNAVRYNISQKDLPQILRSIADYIEKEQYDLIHPSEKPPTPVLQKSSYNKLKSVYNGKAKFPEYRTRNNKNVQTLTKKLKKLFDAYDIEPKFYT
jgi:hypothetical protein